MTVAMPAVPRKPQTCLNEVASGYVRRKEDGMADRARAVLQRRNDVILRNGGKRRRSGPQDRGHCLPRRCRPPTWGVADDMFRAAAHGPELTSVVDEDDENAMDERRLPGGATTTLQ